MTLLRQCWGTRPLAPEERQQLRSVGRLGGLLCPGLRLLAAELEASASQLSHLHPGSPSEADQPDSGSGDPLNLQDACRLYLQDAKRGGLGWTGLTLRLRLTPSEEQRLLGLRRLHLPEPTWRRLGRFTAIDLPEPFPVPGTYVADVEALLASLAQPPPPGDGSPGRPCPPYPLAPAAGAAYRTPLEKAMHEELEASWRAHHALTPPEDMVLDSPALLPVLRSKQAEVSQRRAAAEAFLLCHLSAVPPDVGPHGTAFRLLRLADCTPSSGLADLVVAASRPETLRQLNPFLSQAAEAGLREGVLTWLALCVLEDRLGRLVALAEAGQEHRVQLVEELQCRRVWDVRAHPKWLVFEAEGRLQIRPRQYALAAHLMDPAHAGAIAQLNMGEGKTRVLLPMLALHWADRSRVVRLTFLSKLLGEAHEHLHATLTASLLGRKLFALPFHRDVELTEAQVQAMLCALRHCQQNGGLLMVAREHRLSLLLKGAELRLRAGAGRDREVREAVARCCSALDELAALPYMDVLDESDEMLHHRDQLIYACGSQTPLPELAGRAGMVQAVLGALTRLAASGGLPLPEGGFVLEPPRGSSPLPGGGAGDAAATTLPPPPGSFCGLRLLAGQAQPRRRLVDALVLELLRRPPRQLLWLKQCALLERILACILNTSSSAEDYLGPNAVGDGEGQLTPDRLAQVLALRGLLGCGLLEHGLQKRHRVDYGVDRSGEQQEDAARKRTRMAVPFRAAHVPSERSEFAQPDVGLLLTHLSYYHDGLGVEELHAALTKLLEMGPSARQDEYEQGWLPLSRARIPSEHLPLLDSAAKLDPSNPSQMQLLHAYFSHNTAAVDFWLTHCVLPTETRQFPQRLSATAWHLAGRAGGSVVGFSGTNDNHRLLPLQVSKAEPSEPSLSATNGRMLHIILEHTRGFMPLPGGDELLCWQQVLDAALRLQAQGEEVRALIDCGALLAGTSNREAAEYLLSRLDRGRFKGVTYVHEDGRGGRGWVVADRRGRRLLLRCSHIPEADTFVLFDEASCRGADLKLRLGTVRLLTLGPGATKDKGMQAAGRLRQLGRGQALWLTAAPDVAAKIQSASAAAPSLDAPPGRNGAQGVLRWVMSNTVESTLAGVQSRARQGLEFAADGGVPQPADEVLALHDLYGGSKARVPVAQAVSVLAAKRDSALSVPLVHLAAEYGARHLVTAGGRVDEECERELEQEEEQEEEVQRQVPRVTPIAETDWRLEAVVSALASGGGSGGGTLGAAALASVAGVEAYSLPTIAPLFACASLHALPWSERVFVTRNFLASVAASPWDVLLSDYLRPVDAAVLFPGCGEVLLLTEREADRLLGALRGQAAAGGAQRHGSTTPLLSLCYLRDAFVEAAPPRLAVSVVTGKTLGGDEGAEGAAAVRSVSARALVSMQLLNGEVRYAAGAVRRELRVMVARRREAAEALVGMRGRGVALPRSDLERAVEGVE
ncbi:hypothetical protein HYH03_013158 [Edaphochlamys debaryana]|uniref:ubiquitinyl hydrolase 1 n=1 Tax=Edaphochlamys debaryana TaxID=47281 RepID=A0A836BUS4_9CHLO|nr:hypothetical protein HYH03_013158 [Edaphochlamys debaryana]|eukprot:KAG2488308.1 hypothetical protein HYH03_013158 [Edaphochlamys debaryana]